MSRRTHDLKGDYVRAFSSVQSLSQVWLCDPMECSMPGLPVHHQLLEFTQTYVHWVGDALQPSHHLSSPLFLPPSIFPSIRVFANESVLPIRWPKYQRFHFSISLSNEYSGLISFRIGWFDLPLAKGLSRVFSNTTVQKHQFFTCIQLKYCYCLVTKSWLTLLWLHGL